MAVGHLMLRGRLSSDMYQEPGLSSSSAPLLILYSLGLFMFNARTHCYLTCHFIVPELARELQPCLFRKEHILVICWGYCSEEFCEALNY